MELSEDGGKMGQEPEENSLTGAWKLERCEGLSFFRIRVLGVSAAEPMKAEGYCKSIFSSFVGTELYIIVVLPNVHES